MTEIIEQPPTLRGNMILIAGSAAPTASEEKLQRAHNFVRLLVQKILHEAGGLIVFASGEPTADNGLPLIFDWTILHEIKRLAPPVFSTPRVVIITSEKARSVKMDESQRTVLAKLSSSGWADIINVPNDIHTGGNIADEQAARAAAMIAIGGGKGVTDRARKLQKKGIPVLPFDLVLGSSSDDGDGAVGLHKEFSEQPTKFFVHTGEQARKYIMGLSLATPVLSLPELASRSMDLIAAEIEASEQARPIEVLLLTALPIELHATLHALGVLDQSPRKTRTGINYWRTLLIEGNTRTVAVASFGAAGNVDAAAITSILATELQPKIIIMIGIAAGIRDKCKLGDVVISDRIVAYESAALIKEQGVSQTSPRPDTYRTLPALQQDVVAYLARETSLRARLEAAYNAAEIRFPETDAGLVTNEILPRSATIASGEKLLRDPDKFRALRDLHGKTEIGEMEAVGIATASLQAGTLYLVIRGISDFGDEKKDNRFHVPAAKAAAIVAVDFIRHGLII
jgi:nucleoside phosphorylase